MSADLTALLTIRAMGLDGEGQMTSRQWDEHCRDTPGLAEAWEKDPRNPRRKTMSEMPERIWAVATGNIAWWHDKPEDGSTEYVRADRIASNEGAALEMLRQVERWMSGYGTATQSEMRQKVRATMARAKGGTDDR